MEQASTNNNSDAPSAPPASSAPQSQPIATTTSSAVETSAPGSKPTTVSTPTPATATNTTAATTTHAPVTTITTTEPATTTTTTGSTEPLPVTAATSQTPKPQVGLPSTAPPLSTNEKPAVQTNPSASNPPNPPNPPNPTVAGVKRKLSDMNTNTSTVTKDAPSLPVAVPSTVSTPTSRPQAPLSNLTFADGPVVSKVVGDILNLLQHYGPLTFGQIEFNLPTLQGERLRSQHLSDIVDLLETCGILQKEQMEDSTATGTTGASESGSGGNTNLQSPPKYCVQQGRLRLFQVSPSTVMGEILQAQQEWKASQQRQEILIKALQATGTGVVHPRITLKRILSEFPDVITDPLYVTALRNLNVDVGTVLGIESPPTAGGTATKKKKKRKRPAPSSATSTTTTGSGSTPASTSKSKPTSTTEAAPTTATATTTPATSTGSTPTPAGTTNTPTPKPTSATTGSNEAKPTPTTIAQPQTTPTTPSVPTPTPAAKGDTSKTATLAPSTQTLEANPPNKSSNVADKNVSEKETSTHKTTTPLAIPEVTAETVPQENIVKGSATTKP